MAGGWGRLRPAGAATLADVEEIPDAGPARRTDPLAPLPPLREQWLALSPVVRGLVIGAPLVLAALICVFDVAAGLTVGVFLIGCELVSAVFVKNRTDRQNAALAMMRSERGGPPQG
jgi:hypothetical protein